MTLHTARFTTTGLLILLTGLIFLAELTSEFRLATWLPYFFLTIPAARLYPRHMFLFTVGGWSLLIATGFLASFPVGEATDALVSRAIGLLGVWILAYQLNRQPAAFGLREISRPMLPGSEERQIQGPASQAPEPVQPRVPAEQAEQKTRVLLVDDSIESHTLMRLYFLNTPYDLEIAPDGEQAVATFQTGRFDFVLIDLHLPGMDGFTAARAMRAWETSRKRPPVIIVALTASSLAETQAQSLAVGCTDFLTKPLTKAQLFDTLSKYRRCSPISDTAPVQAADAPDVADYIDDELRRRRPAFLHNRRQDLIMVETALDREDYEAIRTTGHRLKGLAGSFGFPDIGAVGQRLERAARSRDREAIRRELNGLATILAGVDQAA